MLTHDDDNDECACGTKGKMSSHFYHTHLLNAFAFQKNKNK